MTRYLALLLLCAGPALAGGLPEEISMTIYTRRDGGYVNLTMREQRAGAIDALITQFGQGEIFTEGTPSGDVSVDCRRTLQTGRALCSFGFRDSKNVRLGGTASRWAVRGHLAPEEMGTIRAVSKIDFDVINRAYDEFRLQIDENGLTVEVLNN